MLNIPESVKALFKADLTRKNFRVQFPGGELPDITNSNVVRESVHFTESLCSQSVFRFGLAEASVIEFETVGVGNMYGMVISCAYEIDTSSLSAAELAAIQSDPGDGELVLAADSDLGYGFYRVPLGLFRVDKCPRNHGAMTHRKVTAYSIVGGSDLYDPFEAAKLAIMLPGQTYSPDAYLLALAALGRTAAGYVEAQGFSKTAVTFGGDVVMGVPRSTSTITISKTYKTAGGADRTLTTTVVYAWGPWQSNGSRVSGQVDMTKLYEVDLNGVDYTEIRAQAVEYLQTTDIDPAQSGFDSWEALAEDAFINEPAFPRRTARTYLYPTLRYGAYGTIQLTEDNHALYPRRTFPVGESVTCRFFAPIRYTIDSTQIADISADRMTVNVYEPPSGVLSVPLSFAYTAEGTSTLTTSPVYSFTDAYKLGDIVSGFLELRGQFGSVDRESGGVEMVSLDPSDPVAVLPEDYEEVWWDEYDVSPIGTVTVSYVDTDGNDATANVEIGEGYSVYDMTGNGVLGSLESPALSIISGLLAGEFSANAANVGFTPTEMTMQGWPWIEAGDAMQITAEDGTVVDTYALRVELSGIQKLTAEIVSEGGEIIGEV